MLAALAADGIDDPAEVREWLDLISNVDRWQPVVARCYVNVVEADYDLARWAESNATPTPT